MFCSNEVYLVTSDESVNTSVKNNVIAPETLDSRDDFPEQVQQLLDENADSAPLIPNDVAFALLRIQLKYLDHHPCLCTSRFRHTLHQLGEDSHVKLNRLCNQLQLLTLENSQNVKSPQYRKKLYNHFLPTVFDLDGLSFNSNQSQDVGSSDDSSESRRSSDHRDAIAARLETILARFVSDYRGIFAIEGECAGSRSEEDLSHTDHEYRKRHEEEDSCPEEIKQMKVACQELTLECKSTKIENVQEDRRNSRPMPLSIVVSKNNNNLNLSANQKTLNELSDREAKDHHVHRYYSLLRGDHESKGSHHSTRDPNIPSHHGLHHHQNLGQQTTYPYQQSQISRPPFAGKDLREGSPSVPNLSIVFHFQKTFPNKDSKGSSQEKSQKVPGPTLRKRKDSRSSQSQHTDTKRISRSSSEIISESSGSDIPKRSFSEDILNSKPFEIEEQLPDVFCEPQISLSISDEDSVDLVATAEIRRTDFSSGDLYVDGSARRFDRDLGQMVKSRRSQDRSRRSKKGSRSRSSHKKRQDMVDSRLMDPRVPSPSAPRTPESLFAPSAKDETDMKFAFEREDSLESNLSSSPSSISSNSNTYVNLHFSSERDNFEDKGNENITLEQETSQPLDSDLNLNSTFPRLRWSSWESTETAVQDHMQQTDSQEPVISWIPQLCMIREGETRPYPNAEKYSSWNLGMINSQKYLDPTHMQRLSSEKNSNKKAKFRQLNKILKSIKRKIEELEAEFEIKFGYKPSHADKQKNDMFRRLMADQMKLRKQIQACRELDCGTIEDIAFTGISGVSCSIVGKMNSNRALNENSITFLGEVQASHESKKAGNTVEAMTTMFNMLQQQIDEQRAQSGRPHSFHEMTAEQLLDEKNDLRSVLYQLEETFGYPTTDDEKNVTKDVFERYRTVKRLIRKNSATFRSKEYGAELETIPEDLEIPLTLASPQHRIFIEVSTTSIDQRASEVCPNVSSWGLFGQNSIDPSLRHVDENLHAMSRNDLLEAQRRTREEKKHYRRIVKEKEDRFLRENALRRVTKDERQKIDEINYNLYKKSKSKLKLIEALLSKNHQ